jgi:hypothetical protein
MRMMLKLEQQTILWNQTFYYNIIIIIYYYLILFNII